MVESIVLLKEIANILNGYAFKSSEYQNKGHRVIRITNVQKGFLIDDDPKFYNSSENLKKYELKENDILISLTGNVGRVGLVTKNILPAYLNQRVGCIRIKEDLVDNNFLFHFLNNDCFENDCINNSKGIAQLNLSTEWLKDVEIKLPSLENQKKIAKILEKADEIRTKKKQANEKLDEFLKSTFVDMFGDPVNNTKNYPVQNIASFAKVKIGPFGSSLHKEEYITDGIPLVNPSQIVDEKIVFDSSVSITEKKYKELQAYWLQKDDIIIGRRGEIGRAAVVSNNVRCICGTGSLFIRINKPVIQPLILQKIISSNTMKEKLLNNSVGVTMNNLNAGIIENLGIAIPPIEHQNKFAQIVKKVEEQKQRNEKVIEQMDNLFNSLSQRAFKGEL